jgi:ribonuclease/clavin/mitogillin
MSEALAGLPPPPVPAVPRDSAVAVPVRRGADGLEVYWLRRDRALRFAAGFFAFPGGRLDEGDAQVAVAGAEGLEASLEVCAARELLEETGLLVARGAERLTAAQRGEARRDLLAGRRSFGELLATLGLTLHAQDFAAAGRWVTPDSLPVRFDTRFFLVQAPRGQQAEVWPGELTEGQWIRPAAALARWDAGSALLHPPGLHLLRCLARGAEALADRSRGEGGLGASDWAGLLDELLRRPRDEPSGDEEQEFQRGVRLFPLRTPTLPPATHTTAYVLGTGELLVVDPGAEDPSELDRLGRFLERLVGQGHRLQAVVPTHHHGDHVGGLARLVERLRLPVWAHPQTADRLRVPVARLLVEGDVLALDGPKPMRWRVWHTPGHAPGHLCLLDEASRAAVVGDMVAGVGTIVIDPSEGDMIEYLAQLARLAGWPVGTLYPAHGTPIPDGVHKLEEYRLHRAWREERVLAALARLGPTQVETVVAQAYDDVPQLVLVLAEINTRAILAKLAKEGKVLVDGDRVRPVGARG